LIPDPLRVYGHVPVAFVLVPATAFTLVTLLLATLWWLGLTLLKRRPASGFWSRTFKRHGYLFLFHLFVSAPLFLAILFSRWVGTRGDEARYAGPRIADDGTWTLQTRERLAAERTGRPPSRPRSRPRPRRVRSRSSLATA
jgi:hypothetical protein